MSPLHGLGHLIMDQSYVCALIAMMVRSSPSPHPGAHCILLMGYQEVGVEFVSKTEAQSPETMLELPM